MKSLLLFTALISCSLMTAQDPIFDPIMSITSIGVVDSPAGEDVDKIIDGDTATKFLDFELSDGMGFTVDTGGISSFATSIEITTANDFPERDPMTYEVLGSNDGASFVSITIGNIPCIADRFNTRTFKFTNTIDFQWYQINFTNACDPTGGAGIPSMQLAEVQLYGSVLNVNDLQLGTQFSLYPNPSQNSVTIDYNGSEPLVSAAIYDLLGKRVLTLDVADFDQSQRFDLTRLVTGIYFVKLETTKASTVKRLIKN